MKKILVVDDEDFIRDNLERILDEESYDLYLASNGREALNLTKREDIDLILLDLNLPDIDGIELLKKIKDDFPHILVIIITGYASVESAVQALKLGAYDYIKKPFKADAIKLIVRLAIETQGLKREVDILRKQNRRLGGIRIIAESAPMKMIIEQIKQVAVHEETTVLIIGESGTGKELVAKAIHNLSPRKNGHFLEINCAALPENLLESELFGHEPGAFTDAKTRHIGLFESASGGTLFLDEIGEMPAGVQAKLLRVLEDRKIRRLGSTRYINIDTRILAATNLDLRKAIEEKKFREDLYYRLNVIPISIPPLRERKKDILPLSKYFLLRFTRKFKKHFTTISEDAQKALLEYNWPGNVRELKNVMERVCILNDGEELKLKQLPPEISQRDNTESGILATFPIDIPPEGIKMDEVLEKYSKLLIEAALYKSGGNVSKAAQLLGIPRGTLRYKIEKFGLERSLMSGVF